MQPRITTLVHYVAYGTPGGEYPAGRCRAAMVTEPCDTPGGIDPETGKLCASIVVFNPTGWFFHEHLPMDESAHRAPGTWHRLEVCAR